MNFKSMILTTLFVLASPAFALTGSYTHPMEQHIWPTGPTNSHIEFTSDTTANWQSWDASTNPIGAPCTKVAVNYSVDNNQITFTKNSNVVAKGTYNQLDQSIVIFMYKHDMYESNSPCSYLVDNNTFVLGNYTK